MDGGTPAQAPAVPALEPQAVLPMDEGLPGLPRLFDREWVWQAFCARFGAPEETPQRIVARQLLYKPGARAVIDYVAEWRWDRWVIEDQFAVELAGRKPERLFRYPADPYLPGLRQAGSAPEAHELLSRHLPLHPNYLRVETVRYRPGTPGYRDFTLVFSDDDPQIGGSFMPYPVRVDGPALINYLSAPELRDLEDTGDAFTSLVHGDPGTPLLRAYVGDPVKVHVIGAPGSEQLHAFNLGGLTWPSDPRIPNSEVFSSRALAPLVSLDAEIIGGAGGLGRVVGDFFYGDLRRPFTQAGMWGLFRVLSDPACPIMPLDGLSCEGGPALVGNPGTLRATSSPAVPSQISIDGVPRDTWALTWLKLAPGTYEVSFSDVAGFTTPGPQVVTVTEGIATELAGIFPQRGFLRVITTPAVPGTISVDGVPRNDWGMWTDLAPGTYQVCFGEVEGFIAPACQSVAVTAGSLTTVTGTYTADPFGPAPSGFGMLRVRTAPALPSQILVDGISRDTWGLNWLKLPPGVYEVSFSDIEGFTTPGPQVVTVTGGATTEVTGVFSQRGSLRVTTSPAVAGTISVGGVPRNDWGMWTDLPAGTYDVCFGEVAGFTAPACQFSTVAAGTLTEVTGVYTP